MGDTKIEWATKVWNPVTGCTPVSSGCDNCYAERMRGRFNDGPFSDIRLHPDRLDQPLRWRKPRWVFVCSMGDLFHESVKTEWIARILDNMCSATLECNRRHEHEPECWTGDPHTFMVLTKRPRNMKSVMDNIYNMAEIFLPPDSPLPMSIECGEWPPRNLWLGVSVEDQRTADERIPILLETPSGIRFVSVEPMLGRLDIKKYLVGHEEAGTPFSGARTVGGCAKWTPPLDWVICGEESGPKRRLSPVNAIQELRDQCTYFDIPFFLKQMDIGGKLVKMPELDGKVWAEFP